MPTHRDISVMNFVALFDMTIGSMHEAAQAVLQPYSTAADMNQYMKDLIEFKGKMDKYKKREVVE